MTITNNHVANSLPPVYLIFNTTQNVETAFDPLGVIHEGRDITDIDAFAEEIEADTLGTWDKRVVCISESYQRACARYPMVSKDDIQHLLRDLSTGQHKNYPGLGGKFLDNYSQKGLTEQTLTNAINTSLASGNKAQAINDYYDAHPKIFYSAAVSHINKIVQDNENFKRAVAAFGTGQAGNISNLGEGSSQSHNFNQMA